ncbi:hypothetical protein QGP82_03965 [Leptothoe sp. LEGE 181152]|uniref:hypothetical protein n=1 Tax=Adonisia turfae TaxID=2950184 RepID=UPI0013D3DC76|nr:hypothetical protein [Adonisia turfae]MDV3347837.1 hypothetical protein [Leptothoe sp. LEGE 181152]
MSPILFISLPFVLLFLMAQGAGAGKSSKKKGSKDFEYQDGDIIIIRKQSNKKS